MPSAAIFRNFVTVRVVAWANDRGSKVAANTDTDTAASVQPMSGDRMALFATQGAVGLYSVYFAADPGVKADDLILWGSKTLNVLGPARDEAGRGLLWSVDCRERT